MCTSFEGGHETAVGGFFNHSCFPHPQHLPAQQHVHDHRDRLHTFPIMQSNQGKQVPLNLLVGKTLWLQLNSGEGQ